jgi:anthranilate synthase/aminodeoxychorismate synthase-like glutamine amidotransferase
MNRKTQASSKIARTRILFVDNFDSFAYNVVSLLATPNTLVDIALSDDVRLQSAAGAAALLDDHDALVIGPGPGKPSDIPHVLDLLGAAIERGMPVLGVCLGLQAIGEVLGATIIHAPRVMHGKTSEMVHDGTGLFAGLPSPLVATRYHSLCIDPATLPNVVRVTARSREDGVIQGLCYRDRPIHAVQFHPESVLAERGEDLVNNFLMLAASSVG